MRKSRIAIAGLGTVGAAVVRLLQQNMALIEKRSEVSFEIVAVSARDKNKERPCDLTGIEWVDDPVSLASRDDVEAVVELIGGSEGSAYDLAVATLKADKTLITANKALLARHGATLMQYATSPNRQVFFEASVAGGIPVLKTLREGLVGNKIKSVGGILNGTCNFILSRMYADKMDFDVALKEAQDKGFAEADPSADVDGHDTAHKLAVLSALAYGTFPVLDTMDITGIRRVTALDLKGADDLGYRVKLLGVASAGEKGFRRFVSPCLVSKTSSLASIEAEMNAVAIRGDFVGNLMLAGRGAGAEPTASAVVSDLADWAAGTGGSFASLPNSQEPMPEDESLESAYIRLMVKDSPGVLADIGAKLRDASISIRSLVQYGRSDQLVPIILTTHETTTGNLRRALSDIARLPTVGEEPFWLRIETI